MTIISFELVVLSSFPQKYDFGSGFILVGIYFFIYTVKDMVTYVLRLLHIVHIDT